MSRALELARSLGHWPHDDCCMLRAAQVEALYAAALSDGLLQAAEILGEGRKIMGGCLCHFSIVIKRVSELLSETERGVFLKIASGDPEVGGDL